MKLKTKMFRKECTDVFLLSETARMKEAARVKVACTLLHLRRERGPAILGPEGINYSSWMS